MGRRGGEARSGERLRRGVYCQWVRDKELEMGSYEKGSVRMGRRGLRGEAMKGYDYKRFYSERWRKEEGQRRSERRDIEPCVTIHTIHKLSRHSIKPPGLSSQRSTMHVEPAQPTSPSAPCREIRHSFLAHPHTPARYLKGYFETF